MAPPSPMGLGVSYGLCFPSVHHPVYGKAPEGNSLTRSIQSDTKGDDL